MKEVDHSNFRIVEAASGPAYEGLRSLWSRTFGDTPEYVDAFYANFGSDITGYAVVADPDDGCNVCKEPDVCEALSALTCYLCGEYEGRPVYVSYAICTREDMRGQGLAAMLTSYVRDKVTAAGGISVVSPAEPSLVPYYAELGYEPHFLAIERGVMSPVFDMEDYDDFDEYDFDIDSDGHFERDDGREEEPFRPITDLQPMPREKYNIYREAFLSGRPHIAPTDEMLRLMEAESLDGCGMYSVNRGDAICIISYADPLRVVIEELILNPVLHELSMDIDSEIASLIAKHFDAAEAFFITPGAGGIQGMACGLPDRNARMHEGPAEDPYADLAADPAHNEAEFTAFTGEPFYGFPIP